MENRIQEFEKIKGRYDSFRLKLEPLLKELLYSHNIDFHIVESRTKSVDSYSQKINTHSKKYSDPLKEIPDICGCRVITHYLDDIPKIAKIIKSEFVVIEEELSHQPPHIDVDRVGYLSAHYVISLNGKRNTLTEWKPFSDLHAEIQIRTVVQHAWSAVSHALQYKQEIQIPSSLQRRLYRISGLFELADEEFVGIRDQRRALDQQAKDFVEAGGTDIPLSSSSIRAFASEWYESEKISSIVKDYPHHTNEDEDVYDEYMSDIYDVATKGGAKSISDLSRALDFDIESYFNALIKNKSPSYKWGMSHLFFLLLACLYAFKDIVTAEYLEEMNWGDDHIKNITNRLSEYY